MFGSDKSGLPIRMVVFFVGWGRVFTADQCVASGSFFFFL